MQTNVEARNHFYDGWIYPQDLIDKAVGTHVIDFIAGWQYYEGLRSFMNTGGMPALMEQVGLKVLDQQLITNGTIQRWLCEPLMETSGE